MIKMRRKHVVMQEGLKVGRAKLRSYVLVRGEEDVDTGNSVSSTIP